MKCNFKALQGLTNLNFVWNTNKYVINSTTLILLYLQSLNEYLLESLDYVS